MPEFIDLRWVLPSPYGHRFLFLLGLAVFTAASAGCALAPSIWTLVGARVVQAVGAAFVVPTSLSLLLGAYPPERRSQHLHVVTLLPQLGEPLPRSAPGSAAARRMV